MDADAADGTWVLMMRSTFGGDVYFVGIDGAFRNYSKNPANALPFPDRRAAAQFVALHPKMLAIPQRRSDDPSNIPATTE